MTTIAYNHKDKEIVVDSRMTSYDIILTDTFNKTIKNELGFWIFVGATSDCIDLSKLKHNDKVEHIPDVTAFVMKNGDAWLVSVNDDLYCQYCKLTFNNACGSGSYFALAAMDHGKNAKQAVEYAITRDIYSGGKVRAFKVK